MRFFEDGPSIPAHLIGQREVGNVIFFCGAGISRRAGLPDFPGLTTKLIDGLRAEKAAKALQANESYDRVFNALIREFGGSEIDSRIYEALKTPRRPNLKQHKIVLDLSRNLTGVPQIVTTNFDLLFERTERRVKWYAPPSLPDLTLGASVEGIVYLHGRLTNPNIKAKAGYIIGSADFGRAYLAEGWAARFVKALRERYTIVLLGYSANDPPMRYLLEGLYTHDGGYQSPIYAFAPGSLGDVEEEWQDRGVTPIPYNPICGIHSGLWNTLEAWAAASINPDAWDKHVTELASSRPSELKSFERGQVAQLISRKAGAKMFAAAKQVPPSEWLCVFDRNARYAQPLRLSLEEGAAEIDPLDLFGLDDDPARPPSEPNQAPVNVGINFLGWMYGDTAYPERTGLAGWNPEWTNQLPERLEQIAKWFEKVAQEPAALWWAAGWLSLHPGLTWYVNRRLRDVSSWPPEAWQFWQLYLEGTRSPLIGHHDLRWYDFKDVIKQDGWSSFALRELERLLEPRVSIARASLRDPRPPISDWSSVKLRDFIEMKVRVFDRHNDDEHVPDEQLAMVVSLVRRALARMSELLGEIGTRWWRTPTLYPSNQLGQTFHDADDHFFLWFAELFQRLKNLDRAVGRSEVDQWNGSDQYFFGKLTIFAAADTAFMSGHEAANCLLPIATKVFFDSYSRRELLFALRSQWPNFTRRERRALERKIISGPVRFDRETVKEHRLRRAITAASMLRWLELNGCALTPITAAYLPKLQSIDPDWKDGWAQSAAETLEGRSGWVETITEPKGLEHLPIDQIVEAAQKTTEKKYGEFRHYRPFQGLAKSSPLKALSALRREAKRSSFDILFWEELLSQWPENASLRLRWLAAFSIARLPEDVARELRYSIPNWLNKHFEVLANANYRSALKVFDAVIAPYSHGPPEATRSSVGTSSVGGVVQERSEVSFGKAINSPIGNLTTCLVSMLRRGPRGRPPPRYFVDRLRALLQMPGHGAGHAACVVSQRMGWMDYYHSEWVRAELVPLFDLDNPLAEAAWHGRLYDSNSLSRATWKAMLPALLGLLSDQANWKLDEDDFRNLVSLLVWLSRPTHKEPALIKSAEVKSGLMSIDDRGRSTILNVLHDLTARGEWKAFVKPFLEEAWPRQLRYRTEETSRAFARLVEAAGSDFPDAVATVLPLLRPIAHVDMLTYRLVKAKADEKDLARSYPEATLALLDALVAEDRSTRPYELPSVLELIAEADPSLRRSTAWRRLRDLAS